MQDGRVKVVNRDRLFHGLPMRLPVFQWHQETFNLPVGSTLLASAFSCPRQAFRFRNAYGLQFHPEVTRELIEAWADDPVLRKSLLARFDELEPEIDRVAGRLYSNFLDLARQKTAKAKPLTRTP